MRLHDTIPLPGQRIFRSTVAVWLCFAIYFLRGRNGIPFFSAIAVLQCIQPYTKDMWKIARDKIVGTLIGAGYEKLMAQPWSGEYRVVREKTEFEGYSCLKIYDASVSKDAMLKELAGILGVRKVVTFGCRPGYDVTITNGDRNLMVRELRDRFEPVDFRCWRSIVRL